MRGAHVLLIGAVAVLIAGCGTKVDTAKQTFPRKTVPAAEGMETGGSTGKPKANDPVFSNEKLRRLDPCGLLTADLLSAYGKPEKSQPDYFSNCANYMADNDGKDLSVLLYIGETLSGADSSTENFGGLPGFVTELDDKTACFANAVTTTNPNMGLRVQVGGEGKNLCDVATGTLVAIVDKIRSDPPQRELKSGSVAETDPCEVLSSDTLKPVLGADTTAQPYNLHWCNWVGDEVNAGVWFRTGYDPKDDTVDPGTPVDLGGGLTAYQTGTTEGAANCKLEWRQRSGGADGEDEIVEVDITKSNPQQGDNGCATAVEMAKLLVPALPKP